MNLLTAILLAATLYNLVLVVIVLYNSHDRKAGITFGWYILGTAVWMASIGIAQLVQDANLALFLLRAAHVSAISFSLSFIWFCAFFPKVTGRFRVAWFFTLSGIVWIMIACTDWLIADVNFESWGVNIIPGPAMPLYTVWFTACGSAALIHLATKVKVLRGLERLQVRYLLLGSSGYLVTGAIFAFVLPEITHSYRFAPLSPLSSLWITTTATYAIVRYRLMDIRVVLRAGLVYSITIGTLSMLFALLVPVLNSVLTTHLHFPNNAGSIVIAFLVALAFQPLRRNVQKIIDHRFFKSVYDYRTTLHDAGNALASVHDREILVDMLVNAVTRTLRPRTVAIYVPGNANDYQKIADNMQWQELPQALSANELLPIFCLAMDNVLISDELIRQSGPQHLIGQQMKNWGAELVVPLIASGRLGGMLFLGEKLSGDIYTSDDLGLLGILGKQAAIAFDNARHYDEMVLLNEYHERLLHNMQDGVIAIDPEQWIITFNPAAERITGIAADQALGKHLVDIGITQFPLYDTGEQTTELLLTTFPDVQVPVLVNVTPFRRRLDIADSHLIVFKDLSALRALEQEKMQAERFSSMGAMAASLAHEIKNPLVPIQMFAHMLPVKYDDEEFRKEFSVTVVNEVERISRLIGQMLDLVRKPSHDRDAVDVRDVLERLLVVMRSETERQNIRIHREYLGSDPFVFGVSGELYQALLNILINAVQAMPEGGDIVVTVAGSEELVTCRITDSGPGVPQESLPRLFEPLFTTKEGGHGLGLALTYQFVRSNGGEIRAECAPGEGLTIIIALPACQPAETEILCT